MQAKYPQSISDKEDKENVRCLNNYNDIYQKSQRTFGTPISTNLPGQQQLQLLDGSFKHPKEAFEKNIDNSNESAVTQGKSLIPYELIDLFSLSHLCLSFN
ncbi:hypothetical protein RF11_13977 [Thelohanellus kitauei]|uniref:Uncharacterized protein n=1 Tax=Thelohanellus kitauei TaxID=669202 RepID=A0A0C2I729_THEKT|nr:hypothetical protein RF11_13977 [Thelohanellus kitauei]